MPTNRTRRTARRPVEDGEGADSALAAELAAARAKADENYNKFLYAMADFENYKKRIERQLGDIALHGRKSVLTKMLPVLDNLERAVAFEDSDGLRGGLQATLRMFESALAGEGVKAVSAQGPAVRSRGSPKRSQRSRRRTASPRTPSSTKRTRRTRWATRCCAPRKSSSRRRREL